VGETESYSLRIIELKWDTPEFEVKAFQFDQKQLSVG